MSTGLAVYHGRFGRATLYELNRPMATHAHREGHLVFHVAGADAAMRVDGADNALDPASAVAVSPWAPHDFRSDAAHAGGLYLVLYVKPIWFLEESRMAQFSLRFGSSRIEVTDQIRSLLNRITALLVECEPSDLFEGYLYELTRACFDQSWQWRPGATRAVAVSAVSDFRVRRSIRLMQQCFSERLELESIARESGLSRPHFFKLFKRQMGVTPNLYLNTLKMEWAIDRLTGTGETVTDIGDRLGFSSQASFTRFFTANVGIPPTDYRRVAQLAVH